MLLKRLLLMAAVVAVFLSASGCALTVTTTGGPVSGRVNDAMLAVKDYDVVEIIFVRSQGLQVTYEALLAEAKRLGADDIINIRRDVQRTTAITGSSTQGESRTIHTATALAIKYKEAVGVGNHLSQENWAREPHETVRNTTRKFPWGWIAAGVGALLLLIIAES